MPLAAAVAVDVFIGVVLVCAAFPLAFDGFAGHHALGGRMLRLLLATVTLAAGTYLLYSSGSTSSSLASAPCGWLPR